MSHPYVSAWQKAKVVQYRHLLYLALQLLVVVIFVLLGRIWLGADGLISY